MQCRASRTNVRVFCFAIPFALILCTAIGFADPPTTINIRGQLLNAQGQALSGTRDYRVQFYNAATNGTSIGSAITGSADVSLEGLFNFEITLPSMVLMESEAWYELSISSSATPGALTSADTFPNRVKINSVPYALESLQSLHVDVWAIGSGTVLDSEFEFLSGVTSGIQDQLDAKANAADVYTKTEVNTSQEAQDTTIAGKANSADVVAKAGDTMTGPLEMTPSAAPGTATDKLYNVDGTLQWNGNPAYRFPWTTVTADTQMAGNNGYMANATSQVICTLPPSTSLNIGDTVRVSGLGTGGWKIAQNDSQSIFAGALQISGFFGPWIAHESQRNWLAVASSADGAKLVACDGSGYIYTSTDTGVTWTPRITGSNWSGVASSSDGTKLVACDMMKLYTSTDSGATWATHFIPMVNSWQSVASSADGTKLVACALNSQIYTSADSGGTWVPRDSARMWWDVASSSDGTKLVASVGGTGSSGYIYTSTDSGATWTPHGSSLGWYGVASSADGTKLVASVFNGQIYTSTDSGLTWTPRDSTRMWGRVASSSDGTKLVAYVYYSGIYSSTDSGVTWTANAGTSSPAGLWTDVASSSDGTKLVACSGWGYGGYIYANDRNVMTTTPGTAGYVGGGVYSAIELQYAGDNVFVPISYVGSLSAN